MVKTAASSGEETEEGGCCRRDRRPSSLDDNSFVVAGERAVGLLLECRVASRREQSGDRAVTMACS